MYLGLNQGRLNVAALETGRTSWTALLDAIRPDPVADLAAVTAEQGSVPSSNDSCQPASGRPATRTSWSCCTPDTTRPASRTFRLTCRSRCRDGSGREATGTTATDSVRYGTATAQGWDQLHPRLTRRAAWLDHEGPLPITECTVIRLAAAKPPSGEVNRPVGLWWSRTGVCPEDVDRCRQAFLRRFNVEHTFRFLKQTLGWTGSGSELRRGRPLDLPPPGRTAQLRLARPLTRGLRRPWEAPAEPNRLAPAHVHRGSGTCTRRRARQPAAPKPTQPGPGRPFGSKNRQPATR